MVASTVTVDTAVERASPPASADVPAPTGSVQAPARPASGVSDHAIALDFVRHVRSVEASPAESALLREAIDACCHDPDLDVLVGAGADAPSQPSWDGDR